VDELFLGFKANYGAKKINNLYLGGALLWLKIKVIPGRKHRPALISGQ
jgi:hypothetical protein